MFKPNTNRIRRTAAASLVLLTVGTGVAATAGSASAQGGGGGVQRVGSCPQGTHWQLKAKGEDGRIEVELEIDSNQSGQSWTWRLLHNGDVSSHGTSVTRSPSGSFEVRRTMVNAAGTDAVGFTAHNAGSGESCKGSLNF